MLYILLPKQSVQNTEPTLKASHYTLCFFIFTHLNWQHVLHFTCSWFFQPSTTVGHPPYVFLILTQMSFINRMLRYPWYFPTYAKCMLGWAWSLALFSCFLFGGCLPLISEPVATAVEQNICLFTLHGNTTSHTNRQMHVCVQNMRKYYILPHYSFTNLFLSKSLSLSFPFCPSLS